MVFESFAYFFSRICLFTNYVNTTQGFPKPLEAKEEKELFEKMKNGDKRAREKLISHNLRLVAHIVKRYTNSLEADDLLSVGTIGLVKAIDSFDYDKKVQLSTYAARCINNEILMLIRANKKHKNVVSLNSLTSNNEEDNDLELKDVMQITGLGRDKVREIFNSKNFPLSNYGHKQTVSIMAFVIWQMKNNTKGDLFKTDEEN